MKNKSTNDKVLRLCQTFQKNILDKKPDWDKMSFEVRMMNFKVRPIKGDIAMLKVDDKRLIEILWSLGKLEEFFTKELDKLTRKQQRVFYNFFAELNQKYQNQLNQLNLGQGQMPKDQPNLEMEIFKDIPYNKKPN